MVRKQTDPKKEGNSLENKTRKLGWKYGAGVGVIAAAVAALVIMRSCTKPEPETIMTQCPPAVTCPAKAVAGDGECEVEKGEHDFYSDNFAPQDCGWCGDGIQQQWETREDCPVDFHCGNGKRDRREVYGAVVETEVEGSVVRYSLGTKTITESCRSSSDDYCEEDCPTGTNPNRPPRPPPDRPPRQRAKLSACPGEVRSSAGDLISRVTSSVTSSGGELRNQLGVANAPVTVTVSTRIDPSGVPTILGGSASCGGQRCPNSVNVISVTRLTVQGITVGGANEPCRLSIPVRVR